MKKTKVIIPAMGLLLLSTAASITGTVAWFSVNTTVTANGMSVKAKAQEGIAISNAANGTYNFTAASSKSTVAELYPASTIDFDPFLTSVSTNPGQANTQQAYSTGAAWVDNNTEAHYVVHDFYIRSSSASALTIGSLDVKSVDAKVGGSAATQELSKSLRVGVKFDTSSNVYIYGPVTGFTATVSVQNAAGAYDANNRTDVTALAGNVESNDTSVTTLPSRENNGKHVYVYVWFEGEDAACISNNLPVSAEQLDISITFGFTAAQAPANP